MGCNESSLKDRKLTPVEAVVKDIQSLIDQGSNYKLKLYLETSLASHNLPLKSVEKLLIESKSLKLSPLSYCLIKNKHTSFRYLLSVGFKVDEMEQNLMSYGIFPMNLICAKGQIELLEIYLPLYVENRNQNKNQSSNEIEHSIHSAAKFGQLGVIDYIYCFFKDKAQCPEEFNISSTDINGENCAMIACRYGNRKLIQYLYKNCGEKFNELNNYNENCIIVCLRGFQKNNKFFYFECIDYLIREIAVDATFRSSEYFKFTQKEEMINYVKKILEEKNIFIECDQNAQIDERYIFSSYSANMKEMIIPDSLTLSIYRPEELPDQNCLDF